MEDTLQVLSTIGKTQVLLLDGFTTLLAGALLITSLHVIITFPEN
jgi:hypothetical protein